MYSISESRCGRIFSFGIARPFITKERNPPLVYTCCIIHWQLDIIQFLTIKKEKTLWIVGWDRPIVARFVRSGRTVTRAPDGLNGLTRTKSGTARLQLRKRKKKHEWTTRRDVLRNFGMILLFLRSSTLHTSIAGCLKHLRSLRVSVKNRKTNGTKWMNKDPAVKRYLRWLIDQPSSRTLGTTRASPRFHQWKLRIHFFDAYTSYCAMPICALKLKQKKQNKPVGWLKTRCRQNKRQ